MNQYGFFPITSEEIEGFWKNSSDVDKLYFYLLKAEYNYLQSDNFRRSDTWFAAAIGCSVSAIRQARRRLQLIGLLEFQPGWRKAGKGLAGRYKTVHGVLVAEGVFWAKIGFYKLQMLLASLRQKSLTRESVVLMLLIDFYRRKFEVTQENNFFLTKNQIRTATKFDDPLKSLRQLYEGFQFSGGSHLFEYQIDYHKIRFNKFGDPDEVQSNFDKWRMTIKSNASTIEQPKTKARKRPQKKK